MLTPDPPYYACIFSSRRTKDDTEAYNAMAATMAQLAQKQDGFLGIESARNPDGFGITVSYWASEEALRQWKQDARHQVAQRAGKEKWYADYDIRICKVERHSTPS